MLIVGTLLTGWVTFQTIRFENQWQENELNRIGSNFKSVIEARLREISLELSTLGRIMHAKPDLSKDSFTHFFNQSRKHTPEISWAVYLKRASNSSASILPANEQIDLYHYAPNDLKTEPLNKVLNEGAGRDHLNIARDEGIQMPAPHDIFHSTMNGSHEGLANLIQPIYASHQDLVTIRERRKQLLGYVLFQFEIQDSVDFALEAFPNQGVDLYIVDVEASAADRTISYNRSRAEKEDLKLTSRELADRETLTYRSHLDVKGRQWRFYAIPRDHFLDSHNTHQSKFVAALGLLATFTLYYVVWGGKRREADVQRLVDLRTRELATSEEKVHAMFKNIGDALIVINSHGRIENFNPAAETIFGYQVEEVIGKNVNMLMPLEDRTKHDKYIYQSDLHETRVINKSRALTAVRKNGERFPIELNVTKMESDTETHFIGVMHDISERQLHEEALNAAKESAEEANNAKTAFLSSMSHELRTPLHSIIGFSQLLLNSHKNPVTDRQRDQITTILKAGEHLLELINDVLDLSSVEAGHGSLNIEKVDFNSIADDCLTFVQPIAEKYDVDVSIHRRNDISPQLRADKLRCKQILVNLLTNAIKYNKQGGHVWMHGQVVDGITYRIDVVDTGNGIPLEKQKDLFQAFNRLGVDSSTIEGTGIGLFHTKNIVEIMGGSIGFISIEGVSSTFWVELPLYIDETNDGSEVKTFGESSAFDYPSSGEVETKKILYVEDNQYNIDLMQDLMDEFDWINLITIKRAELCLTTALSENPDAIILDLNMAGMDGFDALSQLKQNEKTKSIPTIALSADASEETMEKTHEAGFDRYLSKPVNISELMQNLREIT